MSNVAHQKSSKPAHTPCPWSIVAHGSNLNPTCAIGSEHFIVAQTVGGNDATNAEFIVRACNSHDELVAALKAFVDRYVAMVNSGDCGNWNPEEEDFVIAARAALAKAEGR